MEKGLSIANHNQALFQRLLLKFADIYSDFNQRLSRLIEDEAEDELERHLHSLRGAANSLGAETISAHAKIIETQLKQAEASRIDIAEHAKKLFVAIDKLLAEIEQACPRPVLSPAKADKKQTRPDDVIPLLQQLQLMIDTNNTKAEPLIANLLEHDVEGLDKSQLNRLQDAIQHYDFEAAEIIFSTLYQEFHRAP